MYIKNFFRSYHAFIVSTSLFHVANVRPQSSGEHSILIVNTDEQNRPWSSRPRLVRHFHFLDIFEERHFDVWAKGSDFLAMVE